MKNEIAEFVKTERKKLNFTQVEFARRTGVGLAFLRALETVRTCHGMSLQNQSASPAGVS